MINLSSLPHAISLVPQRTVEFVWQLVWAARQRCIMSKDGTSAHHGKLRHAAAARVTAHPFVLANAISTSAYLVAVLAGVPYSHVVADPGPTVAPHLALPAGVPFLRQNETAGRGPVSRSQRLAAVEACGAGSRQHPGGGARKGSGKGSGKGIGRSRKGSEKAVGESPPLTHTPSRAATVVSPFGPGRGRRCGCLYTMCTGSGLSCAHRCSCPRSGCSGTCANQHNPLQTRVDNMFTRPHAHSTAAQTSAMLLPGSGGGGGGGGGNGNTSCWRRRRRRRRCEQCHTGSSCAHRSARRRIPCRSPCHGRARCRPNRRRDCHSAAPPITFSRCFSIDGERASAK